MTIIVYGLETQISRKNGGDKSHEKWQKTNAEPKERDADSRACARELAGGEGYHRVHGGGEPDGDQEDWHRKETDKKTVQGVMAVKKGISKQKPTAFGKKVKIELIRQEMTQTELASALGINKQYLYKIIYGIRPGIKYIDEIRKILNLGDVS